MNNYNDRHFDKEHIAYFSMEIGISHNIPTYAGGLGILAGDLLKAYADLKIPIVGVTLLNEKGYFKQRIINNSQIEEPTEWNINGISSLYHSKGENLPLTPQTVNIDFLENETTGVQMYPTIYQ